MKMKFLVVLSIILTFLSVAIKCQQLRPRQVSCPIAENPSQVFQCLTLNPQAFVDLISKNDFKSFCHMANGYMTCMSTYIRDCLGGKAVSGILEELQDLNLKCCISPDVKECVIKNPVLLQTCFSPDNQITLSDGRSKSIMDAKLGDIVKAIDSTGNLIDSEVVSILHKDLNKEVMFQIIGDKSNENLISLSNSHLINIKNVGYVNAAKVKLGDVLRVYSTRTEKFEELTVESIRFEIKKGFVAPLTNEGTILVNGFDASCYAVVNNQNLANLVMLPLKLWYAVSKYFGAGTQISEFVNTEYYIENLYWIASSYVPSILR